MLYNYDDSTHFCIFNLFFWGNISDVSIISCDANCRLPADGLCKIKKVFFHSEYTEGYKSVEWIKWEEMAKGSNSQL